jgi:hypothetical protein
MCLRRAPEKYIAGAALDRAGLKGSDDGVTLRITGVLDSVYRPEF